MSIGIYMKKTTSLKDLNEIIDFIGEPEEKYFITIDSFNVGQLPFSALASISFYHLKHYKGSVLFLNAADFNLRASGTSARKILVTEKEHLILIDPNLVKDNTLILIKDPSKPIRKIKNAELRSIIRQ